MRGRVGAMVWAVHAGGARPVACVVARCRGQVWGSVAAGRAGLRADEDRDALDGRPTVGGARGGVVEGGVAPAVFHAVDTGSRDLPSDERVDDDAQVRVVVLAVGAEAAKLQYGGPVGERDDDKWPVLDGVPDLDDRVGVRGSVPAHEGLESVRHLLLLVQCRWSPRGSLGGVITATVVHQPPARGLAGPRLADDRDGVADRQRPHRRVDLFGQRMPDRRHGRVGGWCGAVGRLEDGVGPVLRGPVAAVDVQRDGDQYLCCAGAVAVGVADVSAGAVRLGEPQRDGHAAVSVGLGVEVVHGNVLLAMWMGGPGHSRTAARGRRVVGGDGSATARGGWGWVWRCRAAIDGRRYRRWWWLLPWCPPGTGSAWRWCRRRRRRGWRCSVTGGAGGRWRHMVRPAAHR